MTVPIYTPRPARRIAPWEARWLYRWILVQPKTPFHSAPAGTTGTSETEPMSRETFMQSLADWNRLGGGHWLYLEELK